MAGARTVTLTLQTLSETFGLWCDRCLLPSRSVIVLAVELDDVPYQLITIDRCVDHAEEET